MSLRLVVVGLILTTMMALGMIAWRLSAPPVQVVAQQKGPVKALTEKYLVAAHVLPAGTLARATDITVRTAPVGHVPAGAILDTQFARASVEGALIRTYTTAGAPILKSNVLRPRDRGFLAAVLPPGKVAVSIPVDQVSGVAGLIWPGDHVDVMLTQTLSTGKASDTVAAGRQVLTETILYNARVIAVDQAIVQGASATAGVTGHLARTVTLEVSPHNAERLDVAQNLGRLTLAIRAVNKSATPEPQTRGTVYASDVSPSLAATAAQSSGPGHNVEVIEGAQRTEVHFP